MYGIKWLPCRRCDELSCSTRFFYSLPFQLTVFKTKLLQMFLMVFSSTPAYTYIYRHTATRASSHDCWIYVYAEGYIYIVAFFPFRCSSLPFECHWYMHCSLFCLALYLQFCLRAKPAIPLPKRSTVSVFVMCSFQDKMTNSTSKLLPRWRKQGLITQVSSCCGWRKVSPVWAAKWSSLLPLPEWLEDGAY